MKLSTVVTNLINQSPIIQEALDLDLINITSLARHIQPAIERHLDKEIQISAIVMAIKRRPTNMSQILDKSLSQFMSSLGDVLVRSDIYDYTYAHSASFRQSQITFLQLIEDETNSYYSFCRGMGETTIVVNRMLTGIVKRAFKSEKLLVSRANLAAVSISLPSTNQDISGVYYTLLKRLAWQGINIIEVISTSNEITLIVSKDDIDQVFSIILQLKQTGLRN
jgi:hypothetical protein